MALWNIIRDWFVTYLFGGCDSSGNLVSNAIALNKTTTNYEVLEGVSMGDWLSTTATIIVLVAIAIFLFLVVRWLFRLTAGLISCKG